MAELLVKKKLVYIREARCILDDLGREVSKKDGWIKYNFNKPIEKSNNSTTNNFNIDNRVTETYKNAGVVNKGDNYGNQSSEIDFTKNIIKDEIEKPTKSDNKIWTTSNILFTVITGLIGSFIFWWIIK